MLENFLQEIGLSEKEAKIYLALLEVDDNSVSDLAKRTEVNRTTVYPVLDGLKEKGLIEEIEIKGKIRYRAYAPDRLETYVEEQKLKLDEQSRRVKDMVPRFKSIARELGERPIVEYYEGRDAILGATRSYFSDSEEGGITYMIYPRDAVEELFSKKELENIRKIRIGKNTRSKSLYTYTKGEYAPDDTGDRIRIDEKKYPVKADINVYGDKVRIHILGEKLGSILIKSKDVAETFRTLFKLSFDSLELKKDKKEK